MKRFLALAFEQFYPVGGWDDFVGDFDSVDEAKNAVELTADNENYDGPQGHVVDVQTREIVWFFNDDDDDEGGEGWTQNKNPATS